MYKIILIDDEEGVRETIQELIPWNDYGFEFLCGFENGHDAWEAFDDLLPDVVLTDINMPFMDGLALAREIAGKYPYTKIIMLTGYDDFEYAQQAIKLKVHDYLLKPISSSQLQSTLEKVKSEIDEEFRRKEDLTKLQIQLNQSLPLLKERFLESMVNSNLTPHEIDEKLLFFDIRLPGSRFIAIVIDVDDFGERSPTLNVTEQELMRFAVFNIVEETMGKEKGGIVFRNHDGKITALLSFDGEDGVLASVQALSEEVRQSVEKYLKFSVTVGIGTPFLSLEDSFFSYQRALAALDYRFLLGKNKVITLADLEGNTGLRTENYPEWEKKLILSVKTGTGKEVGGIIEDWVDQLRQSMIPMQRCRFYFQKMSVSLMNAVDELGGEELEMFVNRSNPFAEIDSFKTLDEMEGWMKDVCKSVIGCISGKRNNLSKLKVFMAEHFIRENYSNEDISLNDVCGHVNMSPSYFGTVFKTHTGTTFVEYITRVRLEKAMELLKCTNLKTFEIALKTGYRDPHYFSLIFKKHTAFSPTEYRDKMNNENE